jgi:hypothetical protein
MTIRISAFRLGRSGPHPLSRVCPASFTPTPRSLAGIRENRRNGPQAAQDPKTYHVWHKRGHVGGPEGQYLVGDDGAAVYFVDPGINGSHTTRPDGSTVRKYDASKATLMSYIIKGILDQQLPWALVLLGVAIASVLELAHIPSLSFAVGVYLPLASSAPILVGGLLRGWVDHHAAQHQPALSEARRVAAADQSPGVLMASGYIAGGAIAGIFIALSAGGAARLECGPGCLGE